MKSSLMLSCFFLLISCEQTIADFHYRTVPVAEDFCNIADRRDRWAAYNLDDYVIRQERWCFCPLEYVFNLASWEGTGLDAAGNIIEHSFLEVVSDTTVTARIPLWPQGEMHLVIDSTFSQKSLLKQRSEQMFFTAFTLAFGLLHLILFLFTPSSKGNFYYSIFLFIFAAATYADIQAGYLARDTQTVLAYLRIHRALVPLTGIFGLRFIYAIFYTKCPRQFWIFTLLLIGVGILIVSYPESHYRYRYFVILSTIVQFEILRVIIAAILKKQYGAWIFGAGYFIFALFGSYDALLDLGVLAPINQITNAYYYGLVGLFVAMSVYLARDFARTSQKLVAQERRINEEELARKVIEVDNRRKTKELEEARQLQLSMLPQCINDIPGLDICFHMETATEVGGDYYDYHLAEDGTLTIAIGDATGHGMKAGTLVSIIKSLFITHAPPTDILSFFSKCSKAIKQMRLGNLYMALMLVKIKDGKMTASSAGMPPIYIYRSETEAVEEMVIKGMPLGGPTAFSYELRETTLVPGDTVLLMSDGFPELFNDRDEMLDYHRIKEILKEAAGKSATEMLGHLLKAGAKWSKGRSQGDDITLIVLKINQNAKLGQSI